MSKWLEAAKRFEENSHTGDFFEAQSASYAAKRIEDILEKSFPQMIFLLGEPGSGKSFLLNHILRVSTDKECILIENPFLTPLELLKRLLSYYGIKSETNDVEALRVEVTELFRDTKHLIMLDEAQLMNPELREFIRILSDSKVFWFLIAMHKSEGEEMLSSAHFHSRPHHVVYLGDLHPSECKSYLIKELQPMQIWDVRELFSNKLIEKSWRYSHGNFRNFKKCYYHLFLLLDIATTQNKKKYLTPNFTLLKMAAIRSRLLPSSINTDDFDQLEYLAKKGSGTRLWKYIVVILLAIILFISGAWFLHFQKTKMVQEIKKEREVLHVKQQEAKKERVEEVKKDYAEENITVKKEIEKKTETDNEHLDTKELKLELPKEKETKIEPAKLKLQTLQTKEEKSESIIKKKTSLLNIKNISNVDEMEQAILEFDKNPNYKDALKVAKMLYGKKDFKEAANWAKKANRLDREKEEAWLLYSRSQYEQGLKMEAIAVLKLFLDYKYSKTAKKQLSVWEKETFK